MLSRLTGITIAVIGFLGIAGYAVKSRVCCNLIFG